MISLCSRCHERINVIHEFEHKGKWLYRWHCFSCGWSGELLVSKRDVAYLACEIPPTKVKFGPQLVGPERKDITINVDERSGVATCSVRGQRYSGSLKHLEQVCRQAGFGTYVIELTEDEADDEFDRRNARIMAKERARGDT